MGFEVHDIFCKLVGSHLKMLSFLLPLLLFFALLFGILCTLLHSRMHFFS